MRAALKNKDKVTLNTLRMVLTAVKNEEVSGSSSHELQDSDVQRILTKQAKQRREAADAFHDGGRTEQAEAELAEEAVIKKYLPEPLTESEITEMAQTIISEGGYEGPKDMGKVMKTLQPQVAGRADGKTVSQIVKGLLAT